MPITEKFQLQFGIPDRTMFDFGLSLLTVDNKGLILCQYHGQDEEGESEMVQICGEKMHRCPVRTCERLTMVGLRRGRGRL